jgi:hypothetical protein
MPKLAGGGDKPAQARPASPLRWLQILPPPGGDLTHKRWAVLVRLALAMNRDGTGFVSGGRLAEEAGVSADTVSRAIKWAAKAGLIERTSVGRHVPGRKRAASTYRLLTPGLRVVR